MSSVPQRNTPKRVFIAGGSYGGLSVAGNLLDLSEGRNPRMSAEPYAHLPELKTFDLEITVVDERDGYYHLIGSPLALADLDYAKKAWVKFEDLKGLASPKIRFMSNHSITAVDCAAKTVTTTDIITKQPTVHTYDYFVSATGLRRVWPTVPQSLTRKQYLVEAEEQIHQVRNARHGVVVVGGGAVGIEMAAELKYVQPDLDVTLVHSRNQLLSAEQLSDECKETALQVLKQGGVDVLLNHRLATTKKVETGPTKYELEFTNGHKMAASQVIMAVSKPTSTAASYLPTEALDAEGYVKVQPSLNLDSTIHNSSSHYCVGDAAKWSGIKRCGGAMYMGTVAAINIHQSILRDLSGKEPELEKINEFDHHIGIAIGESAVASGPQGTTHGKDVLKLYFKDDLGWTICWDWMQLGGKKDKVAI